MDIAIVRRWSGEVLDVIGRLTLVDGEEDLFQAEPAARAVVDFARERQSDGTLRVIAARMIPMPAVPASHEIGRLLTRIAELEHELHALRTH